MTTGNMIIKLGRKSHFRQCPTSKHMMNPKDAGKIVGADKTIPIYCSVQHAKDAGWRYTQDVSFSEDKMGCWVCPECSKDVFL